MAQEATLRIEGLRHLHTSNVGIKSDHHENKCGLSPFTYNDKKNFNSFNYLVVYCYNHFVLFIDFIGIRRKANCKNKKRIQLIITYSFFKEDNILWFDLDADLSFWLYIWPLSFQLCKVTRLLSNLRVSHLLRFLFLE